MAKRIKLDAAVVIPVGQQIVNGVIVNVQYQAIAPVEAYEIIDDGDEETNEETDQCDQ